MASRTGYRYSLLVNLVLLTLLVAVCLHEGYLQRGYKRLFGPAPRPAVYTDNPHYWEMLDFDTLYHSRPAIVMIGNSMTHKMEWHELLGRCDVANRGVNGELSSGILARAAEVIALHPRIVFIEGGINDLGHDGTPAFVISNLTRMADTMQAAGIRPVLTAVTHVTTAVHKHDELNREIAEVNKALAEYSSRHGYDFINLNPIIAPGNQLKPVYAREDGCHLTAAAYYHWVQAVQHILSTRGI